MVRAAYPLLALPRGHGATLNKELIRELLEALPAAAPRELGPHERGPVSFEMYSNNGRDFAGWYSVDYESAARLHRELGQALARGMRRRGSMTPQAPDPMTPPLAPAMQMAA